MIATDLVRGEEELGSSRINYYEFWSLPQHYQFITTTFGRGKGGGLPRVRSAKECCQQLPNSAEAHYFALGKYARIYLLQPRAVVCQKISRKLDCFSTEERMKSQLYMHRCSISDTPMHDGSRPIPTCCDGENLLPDDALLDAYTIVVQ